MTLDDATMLARAERQLDELRIQHRVFSDRDRLFGDPAWIIVLELLVAFLRDEPIKQAALGGSFDLPLTTVHRYLQAFEQRGLVKRREDGSDRRRSRNTLTQTGLEKLRAYFSEVGAG